MEMATDVSWPGVRENDKQSYHYTAGCVCGTALCKECDNTQQELIGERERERERDGQRRATAQVCVLWECKVNGVT